MGHAGLQRDVLDGGEEGQQVVGLEDEPDVLGDVLCVYTQVGKIGRTSLKIHIEAWARRFRSHLREKVTVATFTFVAIDDEGRPRPVPEE